jgi:hypothetical protein
MEVPEGNSLCSYLKQAKCHFLSHKISKQEGRTGPAWRAGTSGRGEEGKDIGG